MSTIRDTARITRKGRVQGVKALVALAVPQECAASTCTNTVQKIGNFCSMTCALTPKPVEETTMTEHTSPCGDKTCIDAECQARVFIRKHLLENMSEQDRIKHSEPIIAALRTLLADPVYATADPEALAAQAIETGVQNVREGFVVKVKTNEAKTNEQARIAVGKRLETERKAAQTAKRTTKTEVSDVIADAPKAVRTPRVAKHQPRITDNKEHPVTERITMTKDEMTRAINEAAERIVQARIAEILATKQVAPEDKPVEIVAKKGGRAKVQRATAATREFSGTTLPEIIVTDTLTIPALEVGEESIDTLATPKVRSPYNKARYKVDKTPTPLDKDTTTYRSLIAEHLRIAALVEAKGAAPKTAKVATPKQPTIAAAIKSEKKAKKAAKHAAQVAALVEVTGCTEAQAEAILAS